jgi:hypothetical protein
VSRETIVSPWHSAVAAMIRSGCENVCPPCGLPRPAAALVVEFGAPAGIGDKFNAEADFGKSHGADVELLERLRGDEGEHFRFGLGAAQLGEDIRIEQPTRHRSTPRTGMRPRPRLFYLDAPGSDCQRMRVC